MQNKFVQEREADPGTTGYSYHFHQEKMAGEVVTQIENDFQGSHGQHPQGQVAQGKRPRRGSPYVGTISGCERGEEGNPVKE